MKRYQNKKNSQNGFTLIELMMIVAVIALLSSIVLIALMSARAKGRNTRRLSDMTQMNTALELYFAQFKGYPADIDDNGAPDGLSPAFLAKIAEAPNPPDGDMCDMLITPCGGAQQPNCAVANTYSYVPVGTPYTGAGGVTVWSDYNYYFCLGDTTGNFPAGVRVLNPKGVK